MSFLSFSGNWPDYAVTIYSTIKKSKNGKAKNNIIMCSTRGMVGGQIVFKRRAGKGYVAAAPEVNENRQPTPAQQFVRDRFRTSIAYAQNAIKEPAVKQFSKNLFLFK